MMTRFDGESKTFFLVARMIQSSFQFLWQAIFLSFTSYTYINPA